MWRLRDLPIRRKLTVTTMVTSCAALLLACLAFVTYELTTFRQTEVGELATTANILGGNCSAALAFDDPVSAEETLRSLRSQPNVVGGAIFERDGQVFASYQRAGLRQPFQPPPIERDGYRFDKNSLRLFHTIELAGERIGTVYIQSDLDKLSSRLWRFALIAAVVLVAASLFALLLATKLQASISEPISHLAEVVGEVAAEKDYSVRAVKRGDDELGGLIDGFNNMLAQVQTRDVELESVRGDLERRVEERTRELQLEVAEHRSSELALRDGNERYELVMRATTDTIWDWDVLSGALTWNENFQIVFGYPLDEIGTTLESWIERLHPEDAAGVLESIHAVIDGGADSWSREYRFLRHDRTYAFVFDRGWVVRNEHGQPVRMIGAMQDSTDRRRAETELEQIHNQLLEASRRGGMAEIATNILHNVGNVLNSVNVSANLATESVRRSKVGSLGRAAALLRENEEDLALYLTQDVRGKHLPSFLTQLSESLLADQATTLRELEVMRGSVDHIKEIVAMQQSYTRVSGLLEMVSVVDLVEDSLRMNLGALQRHGVEVLRDFHTVPPVNLDKHKVLQILVNLVRNAKYACDESGRPDRQMTLCVTADEERIKIAVADNGVGIPPENLNRIFNHGFSTREAGHGFGLHSAALAALEMGGSLTVHSDGIGHGATFVLELPAQPVGALR